MNNDQIQGVGLEQAPSKEELFKILMENYKEDRAPFLFFSLAAIVMGIMGAFAAFLTLSGKGHPATFLAAAIISPLICSVVFVIFAFVKMPKRPEMEDAIRWHHLRVKNDASVNESFAAQMTGIVKDGKKQKYLH